MRFLPNLTPERHLLAPTAPSHRSAQATPIHTVAQAAPDLHMDAAMARCLVRWAALHDTTGLEALLARLPMCRHQDMVAGDVGRAFVDDLCHKLVAADKSQSVPILEATYRRDCEILRRSARDVGGPQGEADAAEALAHAAFLLSPSQIRTPVLNARSRRLAEGLMRRGALSFEEYKARFAVSAQTLARLREHELITEEQYMAAPQVHRAHSCALVRVKKLSFVALLTESPDCLEDARALVEAGCGSWESWLSQGHISDAVLAEGVRQGDFTQGMLHAGGTRLLCALWQQYKMPLAHVARVGAALWEPQQIIPAYLVQHIRSAPDLNTMLAGLSMPSYGGSAINKMFVARCLSLYVQRGHKPAPVPPKRSGAHSPTAFLHNIWSRTPPQSRRSSINAATPDMEMVDLPTCCMGCGDAFGPDNPTFRLEGCTHPATYDKACLVRGLKIQGGEQCPTPGCTHKICAEDLLSIGLKGAWVDALPERIARAFVAQQPLWRGCPTEDCPNGRVLQEDSRQILNCACCGTRSILSSKPPIFSVLSETEKMQVRMLVADAAVPNGRGSQGRFGGAMRGLVRECYHCGVPTVHDGGCSHMNCKHCGGQWDFIKGDQGALHRARIRQLYVPLKGWLGELGLYGGLVAGEIYPEGEVARTLVTHLACAEAERDAALSHEQTRILATHARL